LFAKRSIGRIKNKKLSKKNQIELNIPKVVAIVGTGLIGGSMAIAIKERHKQTKILGVDNNNQHAEEALKLGIIDEIVDLEEASSRSDLVVVAIPVNAAEQVVCSLLQNKNGPVVMDTGSTKAAICELADKTENRKRFVATHPMWGTEFSGPQAAVSGAFAGNAVVICDKENSDPSAVKMVEDLYVELGMNILYMNSVAHDIHAAYVSHISHITSFALANTVLEKEKEENTIFGMASGGFESTVRLAKSNPQMWVPIFQQNRENVLDVLNEHISQLRKFKSCLEKENYQYLTELIENSNKIKRILK
jgi:prephenate dehydrogenase